MTIVQGPLGDIPHSHMGGVFERRPNERPLIPSLIRIRTLCPWLVTCNTRAALPTPPKLGVLSCRILASAATIAHETSGQIENNASLTRGWPLPIRER